MWGTMKNLILSLVLFGSSLSVLALEESKEQTENSGEVKVRIIEKSTSQVEDSTKAKEAPEVEIKIVDKKSQEVLSSPKTGTLSQPVAVAELTPTDPDKNLVIYFILLMVIVVGIMVLATLIPAPRSRNNS